MSEIKLFSHLALPDKTTIDDADPGSVNFGIVDGKPTLKDENGLLVPWSEGGGGGGETNVVSAVAIDGIVTFDLSQGSAFVYDADGPANFEFINPAPMPMMNSLRVLISRGGNYQIIYPGNVLFPNGEAPALTTFGNDILQFESYDGGDTWIGRKAVGDIYDDDGLVMATALNLLDTSPDIGTASFFFIAKFNDTYVVTASNGKIYTTTDVQNGPWTEVDVAENASTAITSICYDGTYYIVTAVTGTTKFSVWYSATLNGTWIEKIVRSSITARTDTNRYMAASDGNGNVLVCYDLGSSPYLAIAKCSSIATDDFTAMTLPISLSTSYSAAFTGYIAGKWIVCAGYYGTIFWTDSLDNPLSYKQFGSSYYTYSATYDGEKYLFAGTGTFFTTENFITFSSGISLTSNKLKYGAGIYFNLNGVNVAYSDSLLSPKSVYNGEKIAYYDILIDDDGTPIAVGSNGAIAIIGQKEFHVTDNYAIFEISTTTNNQSVNVGIGTTGSFLYYVDWGDGSQRELNAISHVYNSLGTYSVKIRGDVGSFGSSSSAGAFGNTLRKVLFCNLEFDSCSYTFRNCSNLVYVYPMTFHNVKTSATSFEYAFYGALNLMEISEEIFSNGSTATSFFSTFNNCKALTSIPENLFVNNPAVTAFNSAFSGCSGLTSIPENLFANNPVVTVFNNTFNGCSGLTSIPENLFANNPIVTSFSNVFYGCTSLTSIPENLFANNPNVPNFDNSFYGCTCLLSIPENLFASNPAVTSFYQAFYGCTKLTSIPEKLFANNPIATNLNNIFDSCTGLLSIPEKLFASNSAVTYFNYAFRNCNALTSIPENLFANCTKLTNIYNAFYGCSGLTELPTNILYAALPSGRALDVGYAFYNCSGIIGDLIPFWTLYDTSNWKNKTTCFRGCTNSSNYADAQAAGFA
jgi:hypothetical protein